MKLLYLKQYGTDTGKKKNRQVGGKEIEASVGIETMRKETFQISEGDSIHGGGKTDLPF